MSEKQLTEEQRKQLDELKEQWVKEANALPEPKPPYNHFDGPATARRNELNKKYMEKIKDIMD